MSLDCSDQDVYAGKAAYCCQGRIYWGTHGEGVVKKARAGIVVHVHTFFTYRDGGEEVVIHCDLLVEFDASGCIRIAALYSFLLLFCC